MQSNEHEWKREICVFCGNYTEWLPFTCFAATHWSAFCLSLCSLLQNVCFAVKSVWCGKKCVLRQNWCFGVNVVFWCKCCVLIQVWEWRKRTIIVAVWSSRRWVTTSFGGWGLVCCMIIRALPQTTVFVQTAWECVRYDNLPVLLQRTTFATTTEFCYNLIPKFISRFRHYTAEWYRGLLPFATVPPLFRKKKQKPIPLFLTRDIKNERLHRIPN